MDTKKHTIFWMTPRIKILVCYDASSHSILAPFSWMLKSESIVFSDVLIPNAIMVTERNILATLRGFQNADVIHIIGTEKLYTTVLFLGIANEIHTFSTTTAMDMPGYGIFLDAHLYGYMLVSQTKSPEFNIEMCKYAKRNQMEEHQYLDLVKEVLDTGVIKGNRTGTATRSVFGRTMRFSLRDDSFPLFTTKYTFWRGIAIELLWFISGGTNAGDLNKQGITIWDGNSSRRYLDSIGLPNREVGDLGPIYGFQWRHFGAKYKTMHDDYEGRGFDQLKDLIRMIKQDPNSRRLLMSAWNPTCLKEMALPPCHVMCQFYVNKEELSCQMYQRSADMGLGVPFNVASYALLTRLIAHCCGLKCGEFIHVIGDCHVYQTHEEALREQLTREPYEFPKLKIKTDNMDIDKFSFEHFELVDYQYHASSIKMKMAV